jgi:hypothetical protein
MVMENTLLALPRGSVSSFGESVRTFFVGEFRSPLMAIHVSLRLKVSDGSDFLCHEGAGRGAYVANLLLSGVVPGQAEDEIDQRVYRVVMLFAAEPESLRHIQLVET